MYVCMYVCMYIYIYCRNKIFIYIYNLIYNIRYNIHTHTHIYIYVCVCVCVEIPNLVIMKSNTIAVILRFYLQFSVVNLACDLCKGECNAKFPYFTYFATHMLSSNQKIISIFLIRSH